jgi:uncharacterized protein (DUF58 family)
VSRSRPARSRPALILLAMGVAMFGIARTSGAGWVMVVLSGLLATLVVAAAWPAILVSTVKVSVSAPRDATVGRPMPLRVDVGGRRQQLKLRVLSPGGAWTGVAVPTSGEVDIVPDRRGVVGDVTFEVRGAGPLGLVWWSRRGRVQLEHPVEVGPVPDEPARLPAAAPGGAGGDPRSGAGLDVVRSVREYVPGDPARLVHWPVSARHGSLVVKELDDPASRRLVIVVDLRGPDDAAEAAAARAAGLAVRALREGLAVTMATAESSEGRVAAVKTCVDVSRRLARAVAAAPPTGPLPFGAEVVQVTAQDRHE